LVLNILRTIFLLGLLFVSFLVFLLVSLVFLSCSHVFVLLLDVLEASMSEFGRGIDELEIDDFETSTSGRIVEGFSEGENSLLCSHCSSFDHQIVFTDGTVVRESSERSDGLLGDVGFGGSVGSSLLSESRFSDTIDLFVAFGSVMVTMLTSTSDRVFNTSWMPCSDTSDLAQSFTGLSWKSSDSPSGGCSFESLSLGDSDDVDVLVLLENLVDWNGLLQEGQREVDLLADVSSIDLDFHDVSLLLSDLDLLDLGVSDDTDHLAVFFESLDLFLVDLVFLCLAIFLECFSLAAVPVLVESTEKALVHVLSPHCGQCSQSQRSLNVSDNSDDNHWWNLNDGDSLNDFLLVELVIDPIHFSHNMSATSLVSNKCSEMWLVGFVILWEMANLSSVVGGSFFGRNPRDP